MDKFQSYLVTYGYFAIFILIFFGIVGIPSPEESFLIFLGIAISQGSFNIYYVILVAFLGAFTGMVTAYTVGYYLGKPFVYKFGKYIGLTRKRWTRARGTFQKYAAYAVAFGYYVPGVRQINPYMAGISRFKLVPFLLSSIIGGVSWTTTFVLLGYFLGSRFTHYLSLTPMHFVIFGGFFLIIFIIFAIIQYLKMRKS